jgi:hypothetical protein
VPGVATVAGRIRRLQAVARVADPLGARVAIPGAALAEEDPRLLRAPVPTQDQGETPAGVRVPEAPAAARIAPAVEPIPGQAQELAQRQAVVTGVARVPERAVAQAAAMEPEPMLGQAAVRAQDLAERQAVVPAVALTPERAVAQAAATVAAPKRGLAAVQARGPIVVPAAARGALQVTPTKGPQAQRPMRDVRPAINRMVRAVTASRSIRKRHQDARQAGRRSVSQAVASQRRTNKAIFVCRRFSELLCGRFWVRIVVQSGSPNKAVVAIKRIHWLSDVGYCLKHKRTRVPEGGML